MRTATRIYLCLAVAGFCIAGSCNARVRRYRVEAVKEYPHNETSFTQGLFFDSGRLIESTGEYGNSTLRIVDPTTGKAVKRLDFAKKYFVEGSTAVGDEIFVLTWQNKVAFIYDAATLEYKATYSYPREGWGLTTDGKQLIASDGSARLFFMDTKFNVQRYVTVKMNGRSLSNLNELEYIDGKVWANVYLTDMIVIIDPETGTVEATIDCSGLLPASLRDSNTDVLNGIARDPETGRIYLTGKNWKRLYEVRIVEIR